MPDFLQAIDERCGTTHNYTALSIFSSTSSGVMMIFTIPLNAVIIYSLIKEQKKKYKSLFYKLLLNIAIADLLTGLIADPTAVNALTKEAMRETLTKFEVYIIHLSLFFTDAVALLTLSILSVDRIIAIMFPIKHHKGIKKSKKVLLVLSAWVFGVVLVLPYFKVNFIRQLLIFSTVNIVVTILSLIVTTLTYRHKLRPKQRGRNTTSKKQGNPIPLRSVKGNSNEVLSTEGLQAITPNPVLATTTKKENNNNLKFIDKQTRSQQKATRTFILMLCVFIGTYFPTAVTMLYMNICTKCNCLAVHVMRDISILSILSSSVFRPLNFILTLKHLRSSVLHIFKKPTEQFTISGTSDVTAQ
ncbi:5-hydroxytryptamine receptor 2A-like [Clytia hemisphaerica]|uniref:G-protein coupled receptors family 1 profile domain-containing protein n=1 Tax=Clytia hemisphaerica TaxID=252671 RepID=A0A7M5USP9_9CNID